MQFKPRRKIESEIPSSSMGDIAFLLIIFFMVTTTFAVRKGIDFSLPIDKPEVRDEKEVMAVLIDVLPFNQILMDGSPARLEDIQPYIKPKLDVNPQKFVIVKADDDALYGHLMDVLDELKQLNVRNIALPTKEEIQSWGGAP